MPRLALTRLLVLAVLAVGSAHKSDVLLPPGEASLVPARDQSLPESPRIGSLPPTPTWTAPPTDELRTPAIIPVVVEDMGDYDDADDPSTVSYHRREFERMQATMDALEAEINQAQASLDAANAEIHKQWELFDDQAQLMIKPWLPSPRGARERDLRCFGWKQTTMCQWDAKRERSGDKSCYTPIASDSVGYCVVRDQGTDEYFRVMKSNCSSRTVHSVTKCQFAPDFANFPAKIEQAVVAAETEIKQLKAEESVTTNGIVVLVRPWEIDRVEALVRRLRDLGCVLPVELWAAEEKGASLIASLAPQLNDTAAPVLTRTIENTETWKEATVFAIANSAFSQVLYLDGATVPLRDPTYLFSHPEFVSKGAIFWPDLFHPGTTESNIQPASLLWEYLDMPFIDMFEQDDRQLLIRRDVASKRGMRVVDLFTSQKPNLFNVMALVQNGKDLFRLAWLKTRLPFLMVQAPPRISGSALGDDPTKMCGSHVVQHDPNGEMLFMHRQKDAVRTAAPAHFALLQSFNWRHGSLSAGQMASLETMRAYRVTTYLPTGDEAERCYGFSNSQDPSSSDLVVTSEWQS